MPDTTGPTPTAGAGTNGRLNTWKEIAAYLGKGVRTAERWEKHLGLPVHRVRSKHGESVYALTREIDAWLTTVDQRNFEGDPWEDPATPRAENGRTSVITTPPRPIRRLLRWSPVAAIVVLAVAWLWLGPGTAPASIKGEPKAPPRPHPATWRLIDGEVAVFDEAGKSLWTTHFPFKFPPGDDVAHLTDRGEALLEDIDGNGERELLVVACEGRSLYCYNSDGTVRFALDPDRSVRFGRVDHAPPLTVNRFWLIAERGGPPTIWLAASHPLGSGVVEKLDPSGKVLSEYWGYGRVTVVRDATIAGRRLALIGAANTESKGSSLAVVDYANASATAPAARDAFRCSNCPGGPPLHFFVFPLDDVSRVTGRGRTSVDRVETDVPGGRTIVRASGRGLIGTDKSASDWSVLYTFDEAFNLVTVDFDDRYRAAHGRLQALGVLRHALGASDVRDASRVLRWDGTRFAALRPPTP